MIHAETSNNCDHAHSLPSLSLSLSLSLSHSPIIKVDVIGVHVQELIHPQDCSEIAAIFQTQGHDIDQSKCDVSLSMV